MLAAYLLPFVVAALAPPLPEPGFLGVHVRAARGGLEVLGLVEGGPCAAAGVRVGDVLVRLGSSRLRSVADFDRALAATGSSRRVGLELRRASRAVRLELATGRRPAAVRPAPPPAARPPADDVRAELRALRAELVELRALLDRLRRGAE
jgi:S1-C subfamily serine protease